MLPLSNWLRLKKLEKKGMVSKMKTLICCFCETEYLLGTKICSFCNEYKGLMTISDFEKVYGEV
jgi:formate-dependent nitrite reductase cytochrome c552 subunit